MMQRVVCVSVLLWSTVALAQPKVGVVEPVEPSGLRHVAEFRFALDAKYENPYDPDQIRVDALVAGPGGEKWVVPAFWFEPFSRKVVEPDLDLRQVRLLRFFISASQFPVKSPIRFALDDVELFNSKTGARKMLEDCEGEVRWQAQEGVTIRKTEENPHGGKSAFAVQIVTERRAGWPGLNLTLGPDDWSAYDSLRVWFRPVGGLENGSVMCEFYNAAGRKFQRRVSESPAIYQDPNWQEAVWAFDQLMPRSEWTPGGQGSWRARLAVPKDGEYAVQIRAKDASGEATGAAARFALKRSDPNGFLRIDENTKRYLRFDSGAPYLAVGTNLIAEDVAVYEYYIPKFTAAGGNFMRFWMSGHTLGIEKEDLTRYDQERAAGVDQLANVARDHGTYLMFCLTDFREASAGSEHYWAKTAYSKICKDSLDFFKGDEAIRAYQKRLRYVVARWSASAAVHSWEFFNEVDWTNSWRGEPDQVRAWHRLMAEHLHAIDPYKHVITSSFGGVEDDDLWAQPLMQLAQRHFYTAEFESFADALSDATQLLARHEKPTLVGEFGRSGNRHAVADSEGVSLHNGIWAPPMSGSSGTGIPWYWEWIDQYGLYRHFSAFSTFVKDVRWHQEAFAPIPAERLQAKAAAEPAGAEPQTVLLTPERGSFKEAPFNKPGTVAVKNDGTTDPPGLVSNLLHGMQNHPNLHNPLTFKVHYPVAGRFNVYVGGVSGYGGAGLTMSLDGEVRLRQRFKDRHGADTVMISEYNGCYSLDVPPGAHTITIENQGTDWFRMPLITLTNYGSTCPRVAALGIQGKDTCLLWVRNTTYVWYSPLTGQKIVPAHGVTLNLSGLPKGKYEAEFFDPQEGKWLGKRECAGDGTVEIPLGTVLKDVAVRLTKKGRVLGIF